MKLVVLNKKKAVYLTFFLAAVFLLLQLLLRNLRLQEAGRMVMGGMLYRQGSEGYDGEDTKEFQTTDEHKDGISTSAGRKEDLETYFRPSKLPVLNDRLSYRFFDKYYDKKYSEIRLPDALFKTPKDTILNYYSVLREAANPEEGKQAGCGTIGNAMLPYPTAYNFLSASYQKKLPYDTFLKTFENILHINLVKYQEVPVYNNTSEVIRYFVEIEAIEGSDKPVSYFAYYYGFIDLIKEDNLYKISDMKFSGESYLCAPYHGWSHNAEAVVDIKYGGWCSLVKKRYPTKQDGYVKKIMFTGTDGNVYLFEFFQLTNGTDIEAAQYIKEKNGWKLIHIDSEKCIEDRKKNNRNQ